MLETPVVNKLPTVEEFAVKRVMNYCHCGGKAEIDGLCMECMKSRVVMQTIMMEKLC